MKYRKKPVVVEAEIYKPGMEDGFIGAVETNDGLVAKWKEDGRLGDYQVPFIRTLEGDSLIAPGDYIITGIKGERYPCKPDIFEATYEVVE